MSAESMANAPENAQEEAALWCMRLADDTMSESEWAEFDQWLEAPGNADQLQQATAIWQACGDIADQPAILKMRSEALQEIDSSKQEVSTSVLRWRPAWVGAMAACLLIALTTTFYLARSNTQEIVTGIGERRVAMLNDGSRVSLDAATTVDVTMRKSERQLELVKGRAKFDVSHDPLRPFTVVAGDKLVVALGTSFSVELVDGEVRVILYNGRVEVRDRSDTNPAQKSGQQRQLLTPGAELVDAVGSKGAGKIITPDLSQSLSWEQGMLSFDSEPLASAVDRMNRYSSRQIIIADPGIGDIPIDGFFEAGNVDAFVEGVVALHKVKKTDEGSQIILKNP